MAKAAKTAITPTRGENFPEWYQAVVRAADMAENSPVRGCMIIKPYGFALWENIQSTLDRMIKDCGVQNAYFPLLIPLSFIAKEADHIDGFATECAVVTHHRLEKNAEGKLVPSPDAQLAEPLIVRPTSETIIGETLANWVQSYRDLPMKLNQWANVMRWEMRPRLFLRTSEFLWQEGHNCFETPEEARADALTMLDIYAHFAEEFLAIPVIRGEKTADERFPGAIATFTIEAMMQDGKALQSGTSHDLGQTFSKSADISFQDREGKISHAWTTSWGMSTRTIGGMIMVHGDDDGIKMPPRMAPHQIVMLPILKGDEDQDTDLVGYCGRIAAMLEGQGLRVKVDERDMRNGDKVWDNIKKGVPVRVEIGPKEMEQQTLTFIRRDLGRDSKTTMPIKDFVEMSADLMDQIHNDMFAAAADLMKANIHPMETLDELASFFKAGKIGFADMPIAVLDDAAYQPIKKEFSLSARCIPFDGNGERVLIGKAY